MKCPICDNQMPEKSTQTTSEIYIERRCWKCGYVDYKDIPVHCSGTYTM